jgi:protein-S-isoprenylcysteine O-methyltransferase Ste14
MVNNFTFATSGDTFRTVKGTNWEFTNRALVFGMIFGFTFPLSFFDHQNSTAALANWLGTTLQVDADIVARLLFAFAALLLIVAAFVRTWASSYLCAGVVYAAEVKTESLVADGPYRQVRNPLYFANVLMAVAIGAMMSRAGFFLAVVAMLVFCYRLILREEAELQTSQGEQYDVYCKAVPRLWPSLRQRIMSAGRQARWREGFKAESWYWGFAAALVSFAITLKVTLFFVILAASLVLFWVYSVVRQKRSNSQA